MVGLLNAFAKKPSEWLPPSQLIVYRNLVYVLALLVLVWALDLKVFYDFWWQIVLVGMWGYFGLYLFFKALRIGKVGLVVPATSLNTLFTALIGAWFYNQSLSGVGFILLVVLVFGVIVLTANLKDIRKSKIFSKESGVPYALLTGFFWGAMYPIAGDFIARSDLISVTLLIETTVLFMAFIGAIRSQDGLKPVGIGRKEWLWLAGYIVFSLCAALLMNYSFSLGRVALAAAFMGASPVVTVLFGRVFYKEELTKQEYLGILITLLGVVLFSIYGY